LIQKLQSLVKREKVPAKNMKTCWYDEEDDADKGVGPQVDRTEDQGKNVAKGLEDHKGENEEEELEWRFHVCKSSEPLSKKQFGGAEWQAEETDGNTYPLGRTWRKITKLK
jgi:hypothetical protein